MKTFAANSPLSSLPPNKIRDLPKDFILKELEAYYGSKPPLEVVECDYSIWECAETGLQFAEPMLPGNSRFYEWLSGFDSYYPGTRWEYGKVRHLLESENQPTETPSKILDVGCGKGDFLQSLNFLPDAEKFALDLNEPAVEECRRQGFKAFCGTMETALAEGFVRPAEFPVVTSFHCLEHVSEPGKFVQSLVNITAPGGKVFVSTPYSPMSFEADWFDILNHPPHHMTRWNLAAYQRLADLLGVKMRYYLPSSPALKRALGLFRLLQYGPHRPVTKSSLIADLLRHFSTFAHCYQRQRQRNHVKADLILVELHVS